MRLQVVVVKKTIIFGDNVSKSNLSWYNISWDQGNVRLNLRTFELQVLNHCGAMLRLRLLTDPTCILWLLTFLVNIFDIVSFFCISKCKQFLKQGHLGKCSIY